METSANDQVRAVRHGIGYWIRDDNTFVRLTGRDVASWFHSQTTNDVEGLESGEGHANALLDRQGRLQAHFTVHRWEDEYWVLVEKRQASRLLQQLDDHLFMEDVTIEDAGGGLEQVVLQGPRTLGFLAAILDTEESLASELLPHRIHGCHPLVVLGFEVLAFRASLTGEDGYVFVAERGEGRKLIDALLPHETDFELCEVGPPAREVLRVEAGLPRFGPDLNTKVPIPGTTLERDSISYDKGCYLGQEVVARLRTYGSVKQALMGLILEDGSGPFPEPEAPLVIDGKKVGRLTSTVESPTCGGPLALAYLDRDHRTPGQVLTFQTPGPEGAFTAKIAVLPFYEAIGREKRAENLYEDALTRFQADLQDEDASAIPLLKEAILLNPTYEDAYEVLGVILHRHGRNDEAIHYMKSLARLNPDCMMAHTNLSVFYVAKGMIEEAEEEKAKAAVLQIRKASDDREAKELAEAERRRLQEEAHGRIAMFEEVLEIDPDDSVATFGLGQAYIQLNEYEKAIPHLEKATQIQKDFSAAYLNLGKCHEFLGQTAAAAGAYEAGIACASRKGDLMPLREMERRLGALDSEPAPARQG